MLTNDEVNALVSDNTNLALAHGFTYAGAGCFASVYTRDNLAVKHHRGASDGYFQYIDWLMSGRLWEGNPHFPRLYNLQMSGAGFLVEMERLTPIVDTVITSGMRSVLLYGERRTFLPRSLNDALLLIRERFPRSKERGVTYAYDLHCNNWMVRGTTPVITDPVSGRYENY